MSEAELHKELEAFFHFLAIFDLEKPAETIEHLADGSALWEILGVIDKTYFRPPSQTPSSTDDNWFIRFNSLKRLYRLMTQYFSNVLRQPTSGLEVPDLQAMAKDNDLESTLLMCRLIVAIAVNCSKNEQFIANIQTLGQTDQQQLMRSIERVMTKVGPSPEEEAANDAEDDDFYRIQSEKSVIINQKYELQRQFEELERSQATLQKDYDEAVTEKEKLAKRLEVLDQHESDLQRSDKADAYMRSEIDRLRTELQKSEDNLIAAENEVERQSNTVVDLTQKNEDLQSLADSAARLKDQVDEYKHAMERLQKNENVMEKYKKKLQEGADLRQNVKAFEKQNADLVDKNAALEEEYRKVAAFKPLMESYKSQISELETKSSTRAQEVDALRFELDQTRTKLRIVTEERRKDSETLDLYQERVRELELTSNARPTTTKSKSKPSSTDDRNEGEMDEAELMDPSNTDADDDEDDPKTHGLGGELDDAISGTTMTDLKLQVRKLKRELEAVRKNEADASRILVLENLLEDANRMKTRYETDYLAAQREKLVLQRDLEEIRSGKSMGDGAEAAIALRQRLNESVDQLDTLRKEHAELEVKADTLERELTIAKSDLTLVNKDQLDILSSLRESVNEDKAGLETEMSKLKDQLKEASEKGRMQLEQINGLLLEKISLQSEGIGHREAMLQRERDYGDLRASISGKDLPEDIKQRLLALHEDNIGLKEAKKTLQEQLTKARNFIKDQDKLFKEQHGRDALGSSGGAIDEEAATTLRKEIAREKQLRVNMAKRYAREQELMLTYIHNLGMVRARNSLGPTAHSRPEPSAWLGQQRKVKSLALQRS